MTKIKFKNKEPTETNTLTLVIVKDNVTGLTISVDMDSVSIPIGGRCVLVTPSTGNLLVGDSLQLYSFKVGGMGVIFGFDSMVNVQGIEDTDHVQ